MWLRVQLTQQLVFSSDCKWSPDEGQTQGKPSLSYPASLQLLWVWNISSEQRNFCVLSSPQWIPIPGIYPVSPWVLVNPYHLKYPLATDLHQSSTACVKDHFILFPLHPASSIFYRCLLTAAGRHQSTESYPHSSCHEHTLLRSSFLDHCLFFPSPTLPLFFFFLFSSPISFVGGSLKKLRKDGELMLFRSILLPFSTHACLFLSLF